MKQAKLTEVAVSRSGIRLFSRTFSSFENNFLRPITLKYEKLIPMGHIYSKEGNLHTNNHYHPEKVAYIHTYMCVCVCKRKIYTPITITILRRQYTFLCVCVCV